MTVPRTRLIHDIGNPSLVIGLLPGAGMAPNQCFTFYGRIMTGANLHRNSQSPNACKRGVVLATLYHDACVPPSCYFGFLSRIVQLRPFPHRRSN